MNAEFFPATLEALQGAGEVSFYLDLSAGGDPSWAMHAAVDANCLRRRIPRRTELRGLSSTHGQDVTGPTGIGQVGSRCWTKLANQEGAPNHVDAAKLDACIGEAGRHEDRCGIRAADRAGVNADGRRSL